MAEVKTLQVPREALRFSNPSGGFVEFKIEKGEGGKDSAKFRLHGYTGAAMDNMFFGKVIVDVAGVNLQKKKRGARFSILREHNPYRVLGAGTVSADESGIWVDGDFSMASRDGREVAGLLADGVPLEASISIDQVKGEEVPQGSSTEVNGKTVKGPVFVARRSRLREVSIVSLGADANTSAIAAADGATEEVELMCKEEDMAEEKPAEEVAEAPVVEEAEAEKKPEDEVVETPDAREEFSALCAEFGDAFGAKMFKAGKSVEDARVEYIAHLKARIADLEASAGKVDDGLEEGVDVGKKPEEDAPKSFKAAWKRIQAERNEKGGEELTDYQAMKLAVKLFPDLDINS